MLLSKCVCLEPSVWCSSTVRNAVACEIGRNLGVCDDLEVLNDGLYGTLDTRCSLLQVPVPGRTRYITGMYAAIVCHW